MMTFFDYIFGSAMNITNHQIFSILQVMMDGVLLFLVLRRKRPMFFTKVVPHKLEKKISGQLAKVHITSRIAEKTAERAFNLASAANLGVVALQKTLATPRIMTKEQSNKNTLAKESIDKLFTSEGSLDFLRPILDDDERAIVDSIEELKRKQLGVQEKSK